MPDDTPHTPVNKASRRGKTSWLRKLLLSFVVIFAVCAVFYQTIIFGILKYSVGWVEKSAKMQIRYEIAGTIFTSLELTNVNVRSLVTGVLQKVTLDRLALRYHPWDALRHGWPALVESVEVKNLDLQIDGTLPSEPKKPAKKSTKNTAIAIPFPKLVDLRGIRVRVKTATGLLDLDNANLTLLPNQSGVLAIDHFILPGFRNFDNLHATTSYADRNLILQDLALSPDLIVQKLQVDASQIDSQILAGGLQLHAFNGNLTTDFSAKSQEKATDFSIRADSSGIDLTKALAFFSPTTKASGSLNDLHLTMAGQANDFSTWNGDLKARIGKPAVGAVSLDRIEVNTNIKQGIFTFGDTSVTRTGQSARITGTAQLPGGKTNPRPLLADLKVQVDAPDLSTIVSQASGSAKLDLIFKASPTLIDADLTTNLTAVGMNNLALDAAQLAMHFQKKAAVSIDWSKPWWTDTNLQAKLITAPVKVSGYQIDKVEAAINSSSNIFKIESLQVLRGKNSVGATGNFTFQEKPTGPLPGTLDLALKIDSPDLAEFSIDTESPIITGQASATGNIVWNSKNPTANLSLNATNLSHQGVALGQLDLAIKAENGLAQITNLKLKLPGDSFVQITGQYDLSQQDDYGAQVSARISDLSQFKPLMGPAMAEKPLSGTVQIDYNGTGQLKQKRHEGRLALYATNCVYDGVQGINLRASGFYTPTLASFPELKLETSKGDLTAAIDYSARTLKVSNLKLTQDQELRLSGAIEFPVDIEQIGNSEKRLPLDAPLSIDLIAKSVDLERLQTDIGLAPQATGLVSLAINSKGTLRNLDGSISLKLDNIKTSKVKELDPVSTDLNLKIANQRAELAGTIQEAQIQPIAISGNVPLDLASIISTGTISKDLPIKARIVLPPSSLSIMPKYVTALDGAEGTLGIDANVEGTLSKPRFFGNLKSNLSYLRFRSESLPDIRDLAINLEFNNNILKLSEVKCTLAGGPFNAGGTINLTNPSAPVFDLGLKGQSILLVRNDSVIVRANLDLAIKGPLATTDVTGSIGITDSRFFREIDILPINLPGRPAPSVSGKPPNLSITSAPLRDWKFNVAIKTDDSFKITGNLANGEVVVGLTLAGTGLAPTLDGNIQITHLRASLPFSRFDIENGNIYFSKDLPPLSPILDLRGKSNVRDYDIDAYIWGDVTKPQSLFLSQPPLTQEDILTLLATGVTQSEIAQNPQLLAGRAGWLFIQKYYNKIFKRKQSFQQDSLADRIDVQIGNVDPKTGRESASARLKLDDHWQVITDLDITGGVRGQVRYLLRFK